MKIYTAALLSTLASAVVAFENTVPCLMWSPKDYIKPVTEASNQLVISNTDATLRILSSLSPDICSAKVIALLDQPEVHSNDFTRYDNKYAFTQLKEHVSQAHSRSDIEYVTGGVDVQAIAKKIATKCDAAIATLDASTISADDFPEQTTPVVAIVPLPNTNNFEGNDALLGRFFQVLEQKVQDDYAIIYTSSSTKTDEALIRRAPSNTNLPIFAKYQLFTPGVFMVLGVTILFLFIAGTGLTWLTGIQTPVRMEAVKQKKN
ncbi:hypothetical protein CU097_008406 [Rhizopus azygosporus]|uniref:Protein BIG1 n=2 Tax=Rhizopus TaxID=4842 RepID=A0A367J6L9_RHIAZ|nr:hypothetical protein BCV71DRAFT_222333 [Rhizopus microsporus]RCH85545.1 hypothetical protein CU097_008406 [Rhizopus azygosporus]